jgi:hypothetical protein
MEKKFFGSRHVPRPRKNTPGNLADLRLDAGNDRTSFAIFRNSFNNSFYNRNVAGEVSTSTRALLADLTDHQPQGIRLIESTFSMWRTTWQ